MYENLTITAYILDFSGTHQRDFFCFFKNKLPVVKNYAYRN